jgi:branched-chain amino acid transport system ATP-binding protein
MKPILEVENLSKSFKGLIAIRNLSFSINEGEIVGLIGPNGSGKTTLFDLITGLLKPDSGKIRLYGEDITGIAPHKISQAGVARTFQLVRPFVRMSPLQNVMAGRAYGSKPVLNMRQVRRESEQILTFSGLDNKKVPIAGMLGLADRKRLEIARALATKPRLLLLDEMMSGLDQAETKDAMNLVKRIRASGVTQIVVEHVMKALLGVSDRVIVLNTGEKIAEDTPQAVINDREVIRAYLGDKGYA